MENFDISNLPKDLLLNILNIILLFVIIRFFVYKPVKKFMDNRTARVNDVSAKAAAELVEAEKIKSQYENVLADSKIEVQNILSQGRDAASVEAAKIISDAKESAANIIVKAEEKVEAENKKALENMQNQVVDLAFDISEKLLDREIKDADNKAIATRFFEKQMSESE